MTRVTFESATLQDMISKAARVAPIKGAAFDKASGIILDIDTANQEVIVKATNIEIFYLEITNPIEVLGESVRWRIPSVILDAITSKLSIGSGKQVTLSNEENPSLLNIESGRMKAKVRIMSDEYYPHWNVFSPDDLSLVSEFATRIKQVQWAAARTGEPPLIGIHLDGEVVIATDRFRISMAPCKIPDLVDNPVTIPGSIFAPLMKTLGDVRLGRTENQLLIMPDDATQIRAAIFGDEYPEIKRIFKRDETSNFQFNKESLIEIIDRVMVMSKNDRNTNLSMIIGREEVAVMMGDSDGSLLGDVVEIPGHATHKRVTFKFQPQNILDAIQACPSDNVSMYYYEAEPKKPIRLDGGMGYEALVMPLSTVQKEE